MLTLWNALYAAALDHLVAGAAVEERTAREARRVRDAVDRVQGLVDRVLLGRDLLGAARAAAQGELQRVLDGAQQVADLRQRVIRRRHEVQGVLGVLGVLLQGRDLQAQLFADHEPGRIVGAPVDAQARGEPLQGLVLGAVRRLQVADRVDRCDVGVDAQCHGSILHD
jgi:hypothetical protein